MECYEQGVHESSHLRVRLISANSHNTAGGSTEPPVAYHATARLSPKEAPLLLSDAKVSATAVMEQQAGTVADFRRFPLAILAV